MKKGIKDNYINMLEKMFISAQMDLQECWTNPVSEDHLYDGTWHYGAEQETKSFCRMILRDISEGLTYHQTVLHIRDSKSLEQLYWNIKSHIAVSNMPDIGL